MDGVNKKDIDWQAVRFALHKSLAYAFYEKAYFADDVATTKCSETLVAARDHVIRKHSRTLLRLIDDGLHEDDCEVLDDTAEMTEEASMVRLRERFTLAVNGPVSSTSGIREPTEPDAQIASDGTVAEQYAVAFASPKAEWMSKGNTCLEDQGWLWELTHFANEQAAMQKMPTKFQNAYKQV